MQHFITVQQVGTHGAATAHPALHIDIECIARLNKCTMGGIMYQSGLSLVIIRPRALEIFHQYRYLTLLKACLDLGDLGALHYGWCRRVLTSAFTLSKYGVSSI